jgi:Peptidase family C25/Propeptide_C25
MKVQKGVGIVRAGLFLGALLFLWVGSAFADATSALTKLVSDVQSAQPGSIQPRQYQAFLLWKAEKAESALAGGQPCVAESILSRLRLDLNSFGKVYSDYRPDWKHDRHPDDGHCGANDDSFDWSGYGRYPDVDSQLAGTISADILNAEAAILASPGTADCGGAATAAGVSTKTTTVTSADNTQVTLHLAFPAATFLNRQAGGRQYLQMFMDGMGKRGSDAVGSPAIPMTGEIVAVPEGATINVTVLGTSSYQLPAVQVWPVQPEPAASAVQGDQRQVNWSLLPPGPAPFTIDTQAYNSVTPLPGQLINAGPVGSMRGLPISGVSLSGAQFVPALQDLTVLTGMDVQITFGGNSSGIFGGQDLISVWYLAFQNLFQKTVVNWPQAQAYLDQNVVSEYPSCGEEMMVITNSAISKAAQEFANDRNAHGVLTHVFLTDGANGIGTTPIQIRNAILGEAARLRCIHPSFVTLLGDTSQVATFETSMGTDSKGNLLFYEDPIATDLPYGLLHQSFQFDGGNFLDLFPDVFVGRLPANGEYEAEYLVANVTAYEDNPPVGTLSFYNNVTGTELFQPCPDTNCELTITLFSGLGGKSRSVILDETPSKTDLTPFMLSSELAGKTAQVAGKKFIRVAQDESDVLSSAIANLLDPLYFNDGSPLPSGISFNGTDGNLSDSINAGTFLVWHSDHGYSDSTGWFEPPYNAVDISELQNGAYRPVVWASDCDSGKLDSATLNIKQFPYVIPTGGTSFGEYWLTSQGAVGFVGASRESPVEADGFMLRGMATALFPEQHNSSCANTGCPILKPIAELGPLLESSRFAMLVSEGTQTGSNYGATGTVLEYNVLGDPSMAIRRDSPRAFQQLQVSSALINDSTFTIGTNLTGLEGALITLTDANGTYLGRGVIQNGSATINVPGGGLTQLGPLTGIVSGDGLVPTTIMLPN